MKEHALFEILDKLHHGTINKATALYLVINVLPCILHLEKRVGLKILSWLLRIGMDHVKANIGDVASETDRIQQFWQGLRSKWIPPCWVQKQVQLFGSVLTTRTQSKLEQSVSTICVLEAFWKPWWNSLKYVFLSRLEGTQERSQYNCRCNQNHLTSLHSGWCQSWDGFKVSQDHKTFCCIAMWDRA
jgi:hypothetical protein